MATAIGPCTQINNFVFDPSQVSGLALWLDAADSSTVIRSGVNVTRWNDKSGSNNHATAVSNPTLSNINGVQAINMTNAPYFTGAVSITTTTLTCFAVANTTRSQPNGANDQRLVSLANTTNVDFNRVDGTIALFNKYATSTIAVWRNTGAIIASNPITTNNPFMAISQYNGTNAFLWQNGSAGTLTGTASSGSFAITKYGIGNQANPTTEYWQGTIGEVIIYNRALTTEQRQQVESYLAWKWNLQRLLPTTHPYYASPYVAYGPFTNISQLLINRTAVFPNQVPGLALWLDAADTTTVIRSGANVTQWNDKSGNGFDATGVGNPIFSVNSIVFNGGQYFTTTLSSLLPNQSGFAVVSYNLNNVTIDILSLRRTSGVGTAGLQQIIKNSQQLITTYGGTTIVTGATLPLNQILLYNHTFSATSNAFLYYNGTQTGSTTGPYTFTGTGTINVGAYDFGGEGFRGAIYEVVLYSNVLTTQQRQQIEGYLMYKWNIKSGLPNNHPACTPPFVPSVPIIIKPYVWLPNQYSGLSLWLDAADSSRMTLVGSNITQYVDKSSNQIVLSNTTSANQPNLVLDSNNISNMLFNGTSQTLSRTSIAASNLSLNNEVSIFFVHSPTNNTNSIINWGDYPRINFHTPEGTTGFKFDYGSLERVQAVVSNYLTSGRRLEGGYKRGTTQVLRAYGLDLAQITNLLTITGSTSLQLTFGGFNSTGYFYRGTVCELVWYNRGLNNSEINQIEGYLAWKWGLQKSLPSSHPFFNFPPG